VKGHSLLRNWVIVYFGNFVGSLGSALLMLLSRQHTLGANSIGVTALKIGVSKVEYSFVQAVALGILCNVLVCLAVWLTYSARSTIDKIVAVIFPITAFVAAGFEHSVANMYFIPYALLIKIFDPAFVSSVGDKVVNLDILTWRTFLFNNLIPVTIGNIIGGTVFVAIVYWAIFLRSDTK